MLTDEQIISIRRKAQIDAGSCAPESKEEAVLWAKEITRQVAYAFGGITEACIHWTKDERVDAAGRVHEINSNDPGTVLTVVRSA